MAGKAGIVLGYVVAQYVLALALLHVRAQERWKKAAWPIWTAVALTVHPAGVGQGAARRAATAAAVRVRGVVVHHLPCHRRAGVHPRRAGQDRARRASSSRSRCSSRRSPPVPSTAGGASATIGPANARAPKCWTRPGRRRPAHGRGLPLQIHPGAPRQGLLARPDPGGADVSCIRSTICTPTARTCSSISRATAPSRWD